jgi:hypothetical protein
LQDGDNNNKRHYRPLHKKPDILSLWPKIVEYIGLSEYESKVYLSLINLGTAGARKLSINCDVPRTKVYGTLKKLIDYGLVVEIPGTPKKIQPKQTTRKLRSNTKPHPRKSRRLQRNHNPPRNPIQ